MDRHAGRRGDKGFFGAHRQGDADGVSASQHQGHGGFFHSGHHLRDGKPGLNISAYGVQQQQKSVHILALLDSGKQGQHMLIFGGLHRLGGHLVSLHLADDGQGIDVATAAPGDIGAQLHNLLPLLFFHVRVLTHADASFSFRS